MRGPRLPEVLLAERGPLRDVVRPDLVEEEVVSHGSLSPNSNPDSNPNPNPNPSPNPNPNSNPNPNPPHPAPQHRTQHRGTPALVLESALAFAAPALAPAFALWGSPITWLEIAAVVLSFLKLKSGDLSHSSQAEGEEKVALGTSAA